MLRDVQAERLLLEAQELALVELGGRERRVLDLDGLLLVAEGAVEDGGLAGEAVGRGPLPVPEHRVEGGQHAEPRRAGGVERAALHERLERALVEHLRIDALGERPDRLERPALGADSNDRVRGGLPHVLHRVQPEVDDAADDREVLLRRAHVGRQHVDAHLAARVHVERHAVLRVHHRRDERGHVLLRMVRLQPRRAVGDERVAGGVRLVEGVVLRGLHVLPQLLRDGGGNVVLRAPLEELILERGHERVDLLADRLAQRLRLGRREPGELLRDLHVLLLVDADRVRLAGDRLEARVGERHLLAPCLSRRVHRDVAHRPGPIEGDERDQVLELRRLDGAQRLAHARRLELEHAGRVAAREHRVRLRIVERKRADVDAADELDRLVDDVEVAQPEEVHLEEAEVDDVVHPDLRHHLRVGALLLERDDLDQRLRADDDARRVDRVGARQPLERPREVDDLLRDRIGVDGLPELGAGLHAQPRASARALRARASRCGRRRRRGCRARGPRRESPRAQPSSRR